MSLHPGTRIGPYEVSAQIGAGGMGEVYRATDTHLKRNVAIKVLPETVATDGERLARFQREAEVLGRLNHPNIAQIHGLEKSGATTALVMELVEGPTLADRIEQGPIPVDDALPIAKQIAEALEAAHERGIIHRDLKPANIKLRPDGTVKVLDFGLAKALEPIAADGLDATVSPTITSPALMTGVGMLIGTAAYMSPEQARGRVADKRSDVWAFGCVFYEMLTGQRAFGGEDVTDTLAAVVRGEPAWDALPADLSPSVQVFLRRCLQKTAKQRLHDIADMRLALDGGFDAPMATVAPAVAAGDSRRLKPALYGLGVVLAAAVGGSAVWMTQSQAPLQVTRLVATPSNGIVIAPTQADPDIAISPEGTRIAYVNLDQGGLALFVRALDSLDVVRLEGVGQPRSPFFSPDGQTIGFFDGQFLKRVSATGGPAVTITKTVGNPRGASWGADDSIIYATSANAGLMRVAAGGGDPTELTKPNTGEDHILPQVVPGGRAVLFTVSPGGRPISNANIAILDLQTGTIRTIVPGGSHAQYALSGHLVYGFAGTLRAVGFDLETLTARGNPVPVIDRVVTKPNGPANFALSPTGVLVYTAGDTASLERTLVWVDRQGREETLPMPKRAYAYPRISPDGTRVALDIRDQENDVWIWHLVRQTLSRLTFDARLNRGVEWTPDGSRVVFSVAGEDGTESLFWQNSDGSGDAERLTTASAGRSQVPHTFLPDGRALIFSEPGQQPFDLFLLPLSGERKPLPLLNAAYGEHNGEMSPDGRWLAYQSDESGRPEIYVRRFPRLDSRSQVSSDGGTRPTWSRNGRELFYMKADATMMAVPVQQEGEGFQIGATTMLFQGPYFNVLAGRTYDVAPDGQRFLMIKNAVSDAADSAPQLVVVSNWFQELKRVVPVN